MSLFVQPVCTKEKNPTLEQLSKELLQQIKHLEIEKRLRAKPRGNTRGKLPPVAPQQESPPSYPGKTLVFLQGKVLEGSLKQHSCAETRAISLSPQGAAIRRRKITALPIIPSPALDITCGCCYIILDEKISVLYGSCEEIFVDVHCLAAGCLASRSSTIFCVIKSSEAISFYII